MRFACTIFKFHDIASRDVRFLHSPFSPGAADGVLDEDEVAGVVDALAAPVRAGRSPLFCSLVPGLSGGGGVGGVEGGLEGGQEGLARMAEVHMEGAEAVHSVGAAICMEGLVVAGALGRAIDHEVLHLLHSCLSKAVAGWVVGGGDLVLDVHGGEEFLKLGAGELGAPVGADTVGEAKFPEDRV